MTTVEVAITEYERRVGGAGGCDIAGHMPELRRWASQSRCILELGVGKGDSTVAFLAGLPDDGELWSIDIEPPQLALADDPRWHFLRADDTSPLAATWAPQRVDLLFIDTSHVFAHTFYELMTFGPLVRSGGAILCHDTRLGLEMLRALGIVEPETDYYDLNMEPVRNALDRWCCQMGFAWEERPWSFGLGVVMVP
jgi:hypothetical protein